MAFCVAAFLFAGRGFAGDSAAEWAAVVTPTKTLAGQSIGGYAAGCIGGAVALPLSGIGYQVMRVSRHRYYGHADLIRFVRHMGEFVADEGLGSLLVGDLGQPRGGPTPSGHRSHQTGLDVDIWFLTLSQSNNRLLTEHEREVWRAPSMIKADSGKIDHEQWTDADAKILQMAASQPEVDRVFVNPGIKRELCERNADLSAAWLRKIRPWWKHDDHFHVRLKCPDGNSHCNNQEPLPEGLGCGASLAWWFSKEAQLPGRKTQSPQPALPALCEQIINGEALAQQ
ncbi:MAG: penicillin-insensitive murein endopeptidase [Methylomonas sp.]|nr:penicillin-insensitive murein endopeptidase [Methylomonas sp.]